MSSNGNNSELSVRESVQREIQESITVKEQLSRNVAMQIARAALLIIDSMKKGHKLIVFGNGGSAADAQHMVAEMIGRYRAERKAFPAIALTTNQSSLTAIANDYGFDQTFSRQLEALGQPGDLVLAISTSGNSPNVLRAIESAKRAGLATIGLSGKTGGQMGGMVDLCVCVPSDSTPRIQEAHVLIVHILSGIIEQAFSQGDRPALIRSAVCSKRSAKQHYVGEQR